jgi:hypothetical protein
MTTVEDSNSRWKRRLKHRMIPDLSNEKSTTLNWMDNNIEISYQYHIIIITSIHCLLIIPDIMHVVLISENEL